ncbi:MAG: hypothetical protein M3R17_12945 [Bacteroidota bacterium]|nr:hypothetical protein [Bacteroidota bacterium]
MSCKRIGQYLIFMCFSLINLPLPGQTDTVKLKAHHYLYLGDKVIYAVKDTFVVLPESTPYKIRKDISAYFVDRFKGRALAMFYRPESETTPSDDTVLHVKSENPYMKYQGRVIRAINIQTLDVTGAKKTIKFKAQRYLDSTFDAVHIKTKPSVIRNNLLFDVGDTVNAYLLANNEKNLRDLSFIQDARIYIDTLTATSDSVDVIVITKDLWTIGLIFSSNPGDWYRYSLFDANFLGYGQRLQVFAIQRFENTPDWGYGVMYSKKNIKGSFIDFSAGYSNMNDITRVGPENEEGFYVRVSKPYLLPTSNFMWSLETSLNRSINLRERDPLDFKNYTCLYGDAWGAYSLSRKRTEERRLRKGEGIYLALRVQKKYFLERPWQVGEQYSTGLNDQWSTIGSVTFFKEKFYKTRYVTGFGKTEDVPYGYKMTVFSGFQYQLFHPRYYAAVEAIKEYALPEGGFGFLRLYMGGFLGRGKPQDMMLLSKAYWYTRAFHLGLTKIRQKFFCSYSIVRNPLFANWATINGTNGISWFRSSLVYGRQRMVAGTETTAWFPYPVLGFRIQAFLTAQIAQVGMDKDYLFDNRLYGGFGTGVRIKNENLAFKTLELRAFYFPNAPADIGAIVLDLSIYFDLKFSQSPVSSPTFIAFD